MSEISIRDKTRLHFVHQISLNGPMTTRELAELTKLKLSTVEEVCHELEQIGSIWWEHGSGGKPGTVGFLRIPTEIGTWKDIEGYKPTPRNRRKKIKSVEEPDAPEPEKDHTFEAQMDDDPMFVAEETAAEEPEPVPATVQTILPEEPAKATPEGILAYLESLDLMSIEEDEDLLLFRQNARILLRDIIHKRAIPDCPICGFHTLRYNAGLEPEKGTMNCSKCRLSIPGSFEQCLDSVRKISGLEPSGKEGEQ